VRLFVPFPLIPPKLNLPDCDLPQFDSNPDCCTNALAKEVSIPLEANIFSYKGVITLINSDLF
jgi:hypothetical protein